ncbi:J domain-containing protein [Oryzicola mucosus]|uniref:DnaJ family molecular chaperone n=1 Tax=Oryzicola mucosus TaxID=2767425 RepID=A0A8J6Q1I1_9HYPH|nr:DnaJ family molecular chaperone [Oryzicola mucosus]MBD0414710.1 DnaJ family molecular chaperone [Oryzicola mucosus]
MSIWNSISEFIAYISNAASAGMADVVDAVRSRFAANADLRRRVAFSVAMIALSAKMAKADGVVTQDEIRAFHEIFEVPAREQRNVARLYDIAKQDVAGFEIYAARMARLCGSGKENCPVLEDILDGLFHIAKADGAMHELEGTFLREVATVFKISEAHYETILARHIDLGQADPWRVLGIERGQPFADVKKQYRKLVANNHPDKLIARGLPEEFIRIATTRIAAINAAYEMIERGLKPA